jgi:hypothetical protein
MIPSLSIDPAKKRGLVDQHSAADAPDDGVEAVPLLVENEMSQAARRWPGVVLVPLAGGDEAGLIVIHG